VVTDTTQAVAFREDNQGRTGDKSPKINSGGLDVATISERKKAFLSLTERKNLFR